MTAVDLKVVVDGDLHGGAAEGGATANTAIVKNQATAVWPDEAATQLFAQTLATHPALHDAFIELHGTLGAGKTTFVRHLLRALGVQGLIKSPTYAVVEPYELEMVKVLVNPDTSSLVHPSMGPPAIPSVMATTTLNIWHFDFYRFSDPREWEDAGFRDIFASPGLKIAEWPENAASHLPIADLVLRIDVLADETRQVSLVAQTVVGESLLDSTVKVAAKAQVKAQAKATLGTQV